MKKLSEKQLQNIANILRRDVLKMTTSAGSGHPTSCMSCAELMSVLFFHEMKYDVKNALNQDNDEFILSKGHAAPILYAALFRTGAIKNDLNSLRKLNSPLEGHPIPRSLKWIKVATGSLGQGASIGIGMAFAAKMQGRKFRTYVLLGDGETSEGSVYEALQLAPYYALDNLCLIIDVNRLGQRGETMLGHDTKTYAERFRTFGWNTETIRGHSVKEIIRAFGKARKEKRPSVIIAKTFKGKGVSFLQNKEGWHGKTVSKEDLSKSLDEIPNVKMPRFNFGKPKNISVKLKKSSFEGNSYLFGDEVATRSAYGKALAKMAQSDKRVIAVDAEVSNSTHSEEVKKTTPKQFIETFIAEQNMVGLCLGLSKKGMNVFGSTFATFFTRAYDQLRMSALSSGNITFCGSHSGVSIGEDGASQMGLQDIAIFRALPNSIVFYPSDAVSTEKIVRLCSKLEGIKYLRTTRGKTPVIYENNERFEVGDFKTLRKSSEDKVTLVGAGVTLHECLKAFHYLEKKKIRVAVVDLYCVKPFNHKKFADFVNKHGRSIVIAEDHYVEGGIGEMLASSLVEKKIKFVHLSVKRTPHSGKPEELLKEQGIDSRSINEAALRLLGKKG